jgi:hypothetical protein
MKILAVVSGEFGRRKARIIREHGPQEWELHEWTAPSHFPIVIDDPLDFIPDKLPAADLILALGEHPGIAELYPEIAKLTGAKSMLAPIDNNAWLPKGLMNQLRGWMKEVGVFCAFPKPFCSLTETTYSLRTQRVEYSDPYISEFAKYFGRPRVSVTVDENTKLISAVKVERDATCGAVRYVAENIVGRHVDDAEYEAGMLHHHYPCLASMAIDNDYNDTLLHVSGNATRETFAEAVKPYRQIMMFKPAGFVENKE